LIVLVKKLVALNPVVEAFVRTDDEAKMLAAKRLDHLFEAEPSVRVASVAGRNPPVVVSTFAADL
jgi:hypothetical protein